MPVVPIKRVVTNRNGPTQDSGHALSLALRGGAILVCLCLAAPGCVGQHAIRHTRLKYNDAVRTTTDEQILINIVRLRYADSPVFLDLPSITSQFELSGRGNFLGGYGNQFPSQSELGFGELFMRDSPTLSYQPRTGKDFGRTLATPLTVELLRLVVGTTNPEPFFLMSVDEMNDIPNASEAVAIVPDHPEDNREFRELMKVITAMRLRGAVELAVDTFETEATDPVPVENVGGHSLLDAAKAGFTFRDKGAERAVLKKRQKTLALKVRPGARGSPEVVEFARRLGLDPTLDVYRFRSELYDDQEDDRFEVKPIVHAADEDTIYLKMRSMLEVMAFLSKGVDVPTEHVVNRVAPTVCDPLTGVVYDWHPVTEGLLHVHSSRHKPKDAEVAVPYRGYWFWIASNDVPSRATLATVELLLSLEEAGGEESGPVLTLPVGQ
jgi:hypothetical protein